MSIPLRLLAVHLVKCIFLLEEFTNIRDRHTKRECLLVSSCCTCCCCTCCTQNYYQINLSFLIFKEDILLMVATRGRPHCMFRVGSHKNPVTRIMGINRGVVDWYFSIAVFVPKGLEESETFTSRKL